MYDYNCFYKVVTTSKESTEEEQSFVVSELGTTLVPGIAEVKDGFWITEEYEYTKTSESYYWVSPSCIMGVVKRPKGNV